MYVFTHIHTHIHTVHSLCRHFIWQDNCMWAEDIAEHPDMHVLVSLGGADDLVCVCVRMSE
jgi:hypothetical protein